MTKIQALRVVAFCLVVSVPFLRAEEPKAANQAAATSQQAQDIISKRPATRPYKHPLPAGVKRISDIEYATVDDKSMLLDIYLPEKAGQSLPVVVWIHGGAWLSGNKNQCPLASLAANGYAVVSINYRLSQVACFPAQIHDCKAAIRWIRTHARDYNLNPKRIGVAGASAGGHLVALLGTSGDVKTLEGDMGGNLKQSSRVQAVCDYCGPADFTRKDFVILPGDKQPSLMEKAVGDLIGGPWSQKKDVAAAASPITYVSKDDPPFLIVHGDADPLVPFKHSQVFYDKLKGLGVDVTLHVVKNGNHSAAVSPDTIKMANAFFDKHLKTKAKD